MIAVIDVTGNNLTSLVNSIHRLEFDCVLTHDPILISGASHVILPGVGAARPAMQALHEHGLVELLLQLKQPILGICLGMQLLFEHSEEGDVACLGLIAGRVEHLKPKLNYPVPHMGWNHLEWCRESFFQNEIKEGSYVYFVHGFAVAQNEYTIASCDYGLEISAIVQKNNIYGMQFHPEKSAAVGLKLLHRFLTLEDAC